MKPVAIVGAGITGLTAAFKLHQRNIPFTVYEASDRVGGAIKTRIENGYLAEYGPSAILETSPKITALLNDLGLKEQRRDSNPASKKNYIVRNGKVLRVPFSLASFASTPLFSLPAKLRLAAEPFIPANRSAYDESLADFVRRRVGREFLEYAINPLVSGIYAGDPGKLSVRHAFPKLREVEQKYGSLIAGQFLGAKERRNREEVSKQEANKVSFENGLQVLTETLHKRLGENVKINSPVTGLKETSEGWSLSTLSNGVPAEYEHSAVLLCAPAHKLATIQVEAEKPMSLSLLGEIQHPSISVIVLGFRQEDVKDPLDGFGFLVPQAERLSILGTTFSSSVFPNRAPANHVTLTSFIGGCRHPELAGRDPEELFQLALKDLKKLLGVEGKPTYQNHVFIPKAIPQYNLGYENFLSFMQESESSHPGLFFAGNFRNGISLADSILSGNSVAERISGFIESTGRIAEKIAQ